MDLENSYYKFIKYLKIVKIFYNIMGNSILPVTNKYSEHNLDFNDEYINDNETEEQNKEISNYKILELRLNQIETTTLSNLKLISEDVHHLFELYNNLKLHFNTDPPIVA